MILLAVSLLATSAHSSNKNRTMHHDTYHHEHGDAQIDEVIYDLAVPWPSRKTRGTGATDTRTMFLDTGTITLRDIVFDTEKATLKSESYRTLNELGRIIEEWPRLRVQISGHTDSVGEADFNKDLSERRAKAVRAYLLEKFAIGSEQLIAVGHGESKPVASNDTAEGRAQNRRVEFKALNREVLRKTPRTS